MPQKSLFSLIFYSSSSELQRPHPQLMWITTVSLTSAELNKHAEAEEITPGVAVLSIRVHTSNAK